MKNIPRVWVWVFILKDNKILLWFRKWAHWEWTWAPPWWHLEFMESFETCVIRETKEETNLDIKNIEYLDTTNDVFLKENKHYITIFMKWEYSWWELVNMEPDKCEKWEWFDIDNLPSPLMLPVENLLSK